MPHRYRNNTTLSQPRHRRGNHQSSTIALSRLLGDDFPQTPAGVAASVVPPIYPQSLPPPPHPPRRAGELKANPRLALAREQWSQSWASCRGCWGDAPGASTDVRDCSSSSSSKSSSNEWCIARRTRIAPVVRRHRRRRWCRTHWNDDARTWARRRGREMRDVSPFDRSTLSFSLTLCLSLFLFLSLYLILSLFLILCLCRTPRASVCVAALRRNTTERTSHLWNPPRTACLPELRILAIRVFAALRRCRANQTSKWHPPRCPSRSVSFSLSLPPPLVSVVAARC